MTDSTTLVLGATSLALVVVLYVWFALALAAMFRKIGAPAWKAWIPVLNVATLLALGGFSPWLVLLNLAPLFGFIAFFIVLVVAMHRLTVGFGGGAGLTVVGALFPVVWASILGFGSARWEGDRPVDEESVPVRRGQDFQGPYVPLMGGWTPDDSPDRRADDDVARPDAPAVSEPVVLPFAAPSGSLADAVPSPSDWAPPADLQPAHPGARRSAESPAVDEPRDAPLPAGSVFEVLDALRDGSPADRSPADGSPSGRGPASERDAESPAPSAALRPQDDPAAPTADIPAPLSSGRSTPVPVDDAETRALLLPGSPTRGMPSWTPSAPEPAPVEGESARSDDGDDAAPWGGPPRRTPHSDAERSAPIAEVPLTRPAPEPLPAPRAAHSPVGDEFPELSEAVSAVSEAPDAGAPRSARTSVSALYTRPEVPADPDDFDALDRTVVTRRKRIPWVLVPPNGATVDLASTVVILGRRPSADAAHPDAQLVPIVDETRTVSKTHARLELRGDTWYVTDLDSTNGVLFATLMGTEVEAPPGEEIEAGERFFLGDAEVRLTRREV